MSNDRLPLTGPDCFLRALDRETRTFNGASHLSQLVLRLDSLPDPGELREFTREVFRAAPLLTARVRRPWGVAPPAYVPRPEHRRTDGARITWHDPGEHGEAPAPLRRRLNGRFDTAEGPHLHVDVLPDDRGGRLALTWSHMLLDGAGSETFVGLLQRAWGRWKRDDPMPSALRPAPTSPLDRFVEGTSWRERLSRSREWARRMNEESDPLPRSLTGPLTATPQNLTWKRRVFANQKAKAIRERARAHAGAMRSMLFYLAVSLRAHHRVHRFRKTPPQTYLVPVPVNMRRGASKPIFRSHVSFLWFRAPAERIPDFEALMEHLRQRRKSMIRDGMEQLAAVALDAFRGMPTPLYHRMIRRPFGGEIASFFFSFTGDFLPDLDTFLGGRVTDGHHVPSVPVSPGSGLIWNRHRDRVSTRRGC